MENPGTYLAAMRHTAPLVHNITNYVAMNVMVNVLLAAGASPAMVHAREEVAEFTPIAQSLSINIGTISPHWAEAMEMAATVAGEQSLGDWLTWTLSCPCGSITCLASRSCWGRS